jgi:hypothetical protein
MNYDLCLFLHSGASPAAGYGLTWTLAGSSVGPSTLAAYRQTAAVSQPSVGANVYQSADIHHVPSPQVAFNPVLLVDNLPEAVNLGLGQLRHLWPGVALYAGLFHHLLSGVQTDAKNPREGNVNTLAIGYVYSNYSNHVNSLTLPLGMPGITANYSNDALPLYYTAFIASYFYGRFYLHCLNYLNL